MRCILLSQSRIGRVRFPAEVLQSPTRASRQNSQNPPRGLFQGLAGPSSYGTRLDYRQATGSQKGAAMVVVLSMLDRFPFELACGHHVVLGRLQGSQSWICERCGRPTDLTDEPYKTALYHMLRVAEGIDVRERESGNTVTRVC
jgi:hypothetical protein